MKEETEPTAQGEGECSVCVALKIRPLVPSEQEQGCASALTVTPGLPQVSSIGRQNTFTYDHVFGGDFGAAPDQLYSKCVAPLVDGLFKGYNATVFAYGQTGSGKTYTMGSEYKPGGKAHGVIPEAINAIFNKIAATPDCNSAVRVSFVEIHKEEVKDLLYTSAGPRPSISVRENPGGGVCLYGAVEKEVRNKEEMVQVLELGTLCRSTAATGMNSKSSRSHAIFTITLEQRRQLPSTTPTTAAAAAATVVSPGVDDEDDAAELEEEQLDDYLCAKMHLVDLAGSERLKRTKAEDERRYEGIKINQGLLALGNVINAIVDKKPHVPYRVSKLTRLLQDSLGGNSRTVMIACVSDADINFEETLNTLKYADRARHIRNKPVVNRDPVAAQVAFLRAQVAQLRVENGALKKALEADGKDVNNLQQPDEHWQIIEQLRQENTALEIENEKMKIQLEEQQKELLELNAKYVNVQADLDLLRLQQRGLPLDATAAAAMEAGADACNVPDQAPTLDVLRGYIARIAELEKEVRNFKSFQQLSVWRKKMSFGGAATAENGLAQPGTPSQPVHDTSSPGGDLHRAPGSPSTDDMAASPDDSNMDEEIFYAEMAAHALEQEKMKQDMAALQRVLEAKERKMQELLRNSGQVPQLKQHYDRVLQELERERDALLNEKTAMLQKLHAIVASSEEERKRLEVQYKERIAQYDERLREVRRKEREFISMQKLKMRTEEMCARLNADISRIKQQKVALQKHIEASAKQFAAWRVEREKELVQLRKQNRKNVVQIQHLEAMQAKQNAVLQRKIADATAARKKLKELQSGQGAGARDRGVASVSTSLANGITLNSSGTVDMQPNVAAPLLRSEKARRDWLEKELDRCTQSFEYRRVLEGELAQRAEINAQLREVEKKLMMCDNLVPASPLVLAPEQHAAHAKASSILSGSGAGGAAAAAAGGLRPGETKDWLLERKVQLQQQLLEHNVQIQELQCAWEKAKLEEEHKGGGAADVRRWTGIRNIVEARELLKTLFKAACDHKAQVNDYALEAVKLGEEMDLMRVQLDAARKEAEALRKRSAAIEATAATAMATPFATDASHAVHQHDETDREVDDLLQQLQVAASTPSGTLLPNGEAELSNAAGVQEADAVGSPDGSVKVSIEVPLMLPKALEFLSPTRPLPNGTSGCAGPVSPSPGSNTLRALNLMDVDMSGGGSVAGSVPGAAGKVPSGKAAARYENSLRYGHDPDHDDNEGSAEQNDATNVASCSDDDVLEDDEEEDYGDDKDDADWDPAHATPARPGRLRRSSARLSQGSAGPASSTSAAAVPRSQSARPAAANGTHPAAIFRPAAAAVATSTSTSSSNGSGIAAASLEQPVLAHINQQLAGQGLPLMDKLTVKLLKDHLAGKMVDGRLWRAGSKTKELLLRDYRSMLGLLPDSEDAALSAQHGTGGARGTHSSGGGFGASLGGSGTALATSSGSGTACSAQTAPVPIDLTISTTPPPPSSTSSPAAVPDPTHLPSSPSASTRDYRAAVLITSPKAADAARSAAAGSTSFVSTSTSGRGGLSRAHGSTSAHATPPSPSPSPRPSPLRSSSHHQAGGSSASSFRLSSPQQQKLHASTTQLRQSFSPLVTPSPRASTLSPRIPVSAFSPRGLVSPAATSAKFQVPDSPMSDWSLGANQQVGQQQQAGNMTPLSMMYMQKAQEARERTAVLRQSIQKNIRDKYDMAHLRASHPAVPTFSLMAAAGSSSPVASPSAAGMSAAGATEGRMSPRSQLVRDSMNRKVWR